mgnify:CR=1 FL=1
MSLFKNIIILLTLISFFSCAPTTIEKKKPIEKAPEKVEEIEILEEKEKEIEKVETVKKPSKLSFWLNRSFIPKCHYINSPISIYLFLEKINY